MPYLKMEYKYEKVSNSNLSCSFLNGNNYPLVSWASSSCAKYTTDGAPESVRYKLITQI